MFFPHFDDLINFFSCSVKNKKEEKTFSNSEKMQDFFHSQEKGKNFIVQQSEKIF